MDPRDPHFNRSSYDPYNPPFHHRNSDLSGPPGFYYPHPPLPPPPPPPPPRQHRHPRDHFNHHHHPDDPRVYLPHPPDRPPFDPTIPVRTAIRVPHRPSEQWVGSSEARRDRDFDVRRVEPPERYWTREDENLAEDFRVRFVDDCPGGRRLEQFPPDVQELDYSPRVLEPSFMPRPNLERAPVVEVSDAVGLGMGTEIGYHGDRYQEDHYYHGNRYQVDHYVVNKGKKRMPDMGYEDHGFRENPYVGNAGKRMSDKGYEDHSFRENPYVGNAGKRRNFNGGNFQYSERSAMKRPVQKTSALGRIQSGVSVWNRIEEKQASSSPASLNDLGFVEDQPDAEALDLSYKSNSLVAKVMAPSSSSPTLHPESVGKGPKVVTPKDRAKMKKVSKDREKVVVSIVSGVASAATAKGIADLKKPRRTSPFKHPNHLEGSENIVCSSSELASGAHAQLLSKKEINLPQGTNCSEGSKKVVISTSKSSSVSTPQSSFKRRPIASSSGTTTVGASSKPVPTVENNSNLVNQFDGLEKTINSLSEPSERASSDASFKTKISPSGSVVCGGSSEPLPKMGSSTLKESNHSKGSKNLAASFDVLESSISLQNSLKKAASSSDAAIGSSIQILSETEITPLQGFSYSDGSVKIIASSSKPLSGHSLASSVQPVSNAITAKTGKNTHVSNSSLGSEKVLLSSTKPLTGSNLKRSSKRKLVASRNPAGGTSTKPLCIADGNSVHVSNDTKESEKVEDSSKPSCHSGFQKSSKSVIASSGMPASGAKSKASSKKATKKSAVKKNAAKRAAKTVIMVENRTSKDSVQEAKTIKEKPTDGLSSHPCPPGPMELMASIEDSAAEQCSKDVNLVQGVDIEGTREEKSSIPSEKIDQNSHYPVVSNSVSASDPSFEPFAQEVATIRSQSKGIALVVNNIIEDQSKRLRRALDDVGSLAQSSNMLAISSYDELSSFGSVGKAAVISSAVTESSISGCGTSKARNVKRKRQILDQQILEFPAVSEGLEIPAEQIPEGSFVPLPSETSNLVVTQSPPNFDMGQEVYASTLASSDELTPFNNLSMQDDSLLIHTNNLADDLKEQPLPLCTEINTLIDVPNIQDASNFMESEWSNSMLLKIKGCSEKDDSDHHDEKPTTKSDFRLDETMQNIEPVFDKNQLLSSHESKEEITTDAKLMEGRYSNTKAILGTGVPNNSQNRMNSASSSKGSTCKNARNKTWHRLDTSFASQTSGNLQYGIGLKDVSKKHSPKKLGRVVNPSYVRKGNSLIRKPTNGVFPPMPPLGPGASDRQNTSLTDRSIFAGYKGNNSNRTAGNPSFERPKTPPLPMGSKLPSCGMDPMKDSSQFTSEYPVPDSGIEDLGIHLESQSRDLVSGSVHNHSIPSCTSSEPLTRKRMIYVKHKSNQLVAAPQPVVGNTSSNLAENAQKLPTSTLSDLYYRRKKNQLILNALSSDSQHKQDIDDVNLDDQGTSKVSAKPFKKRLDKVLRKTYKHSKSSRVWMLNGEEQGKKGFTPANLRKVTPYLFPWKRTTYCRTSTNRHSLSLIRKLQFTRKRDTIYKVSTNGYSLRKTGIVSIGGASLKWSKSIEKHSKKANEEATLAVAEVERRKRERQGSTSIQTRKKNRNSLSRKSAFGNQLKRGERIFRVGSVRYKMDSSKRTLIRIPDDQSSSPVGQQSTNNTFVPRRLLIGNDEYIRIGNGNQLVRDPKKLVRILASEKVRWSLHTARSRLAKKKQYCQFFTRFGKCNKSAGKCPYMHDPAKVAICTKFLRGLCSDSSCKLTHKVLPERMPDCSYFLQGLCTKIHCPYRHVNVNPNALVCDGFLRGYCADGDECCKKHSYVCPHLEETGKCAQGSKCKLHHPKSRKKSKKRKRQQVQSSSRGRYFLSDIVKVGERVVAASEKNNDGGGDAFLSGEWGADFISIDPNSDCDDDIEADSPGGSSPKKLKVDLFDPDDVDSLIKPIRIMNKDNLTNVPASALI